MAANNDRCGSATRHFREGLMKAPRKEIRIPQFMEPISHYTDAVLCGDHLFLSGVGAFDENGDIAAKGDVVGQTRKICETIQTVLEQAGMAFEDIIYFKVFIINVEDRPKINPVRQEFHGDSRPGSSLVGVTKLDHPDMLLEVDIVAYKPLSGGPPRKQIRIPGFPEPLSHFTDGVLCGDYLWLAGTGAFDEDYNILGGDDVAAQARNTMLNVQKVLRAADMGFEDVAKFVVYLENINDRPKINPVRQEFFGTHRPASTLYEVKNLAIPGMLIEIEVIAYKPSGGAPPRQEIRLPQLNEPISHYTDAVKCGDLLFMAGAGSFDSDLNIVGENDIVAQAVKTHENMQLVLEAAGMGFEDMAKVIILMADIGDRPKINPVRQRFYGKSRPASTMIQSNDLAVPGMLIEIEGVVYKPSA